MLGQELAHWADVLFDSALKLAVVALAWCATLQGCQEKKTVSIRDK